MLTKLEATFLFCSYCGENFYVTEGYFLNAVKSRLVCTVEGYTLGPRRYIWIRTGNGTKLNILNAV